MEAFDVIVIGTGGVGSATLYHLAKQGVRVLGLDQFPQAHTNGSSHGQTRIIRQAYFEHVDYVPLLTHAYGYWDHIQRECEKQLFYQVGLLEVGPSDGVLIPGVRQSAVEHYVPVDWFTAKEARQQFPFHIDDEMEVAFEPSAGYLLVEECVATMLKQAERDGAKWRQQRVLNWSATQSGIAVTTDQATYSAGHVIFCGGAWSAQLLEDLGLPLRVVAKQQYWIPPTPETGDMTGWPTYFFETDAGYFYGIPQVSERGSKVAQHSGGLAWSDPQSLDDVTDAADESAVRTFLRSAFPVGATLPFTHQTCMYTLSKDEHFIIDQHPLYDSVHFAAGLSGHGFKFTPVLGQIMADLAIHGSSDLPIDFLRIARFA